MLKFKVPQDTDYFRYLNMNPLNKKVGDCVIRAISTGTNQGWDEIYTELCKLGFEMKMMPNADDVYVKYLENLGWVRHKEPRKKDNTRYTAKEFIKKFKPKTPIIARIGTNHLSVIVDGKVTDIWDCENHYIHTYWMKEDL